MTCEYASILGLMAPRRGKINPANVIPGSCGRSRLRWRKHCKVLALEPI